MKKPSAPLHVLVFAPTGQDAALLANALDADSVSTLIFREMSALIAQLSTGCGALLIAEEALTPLAVTQLNENFRNQESWSDIPVIVLTFGKETTASNRIFETFSAKGNVSILERPFRKPTLLSVVKVALRSRQKQYEVRDLLLEQTEATKIRDEFISIASHELKTPLTSLKLQTQINQRLLSKQGNAGLAIERVQQLVEVTSKQVDRLSRLVEDMLDVTRAGTGKLTMDFKPLDLSTVANEIIDSMRVQLAQANCALDVDLEKGLMVSADEFRIGQVLTNLMTNVVRYAAGKPVKVSCKKKNSTALISVEDQGQGIPENNLSKIFDRFERAVNARNISGLGLGLYICNEIVKAHHGKIHVASTIGRGTVFEVELPLTNT